MMLIERAELLESLHQLFSSAAHEGHCALVGAEAGMGKTSLLKVFKQELRNDCIRLEGSCDALFTPRPLAPVYDLAHQLESTLFQDDMAITDRSGLFARFLQELEQQKLPLLIIIEDIHWADEATLDFIKFLSRRIHRIKGLLVLTYRDNEIHPQHPLRYVLGQMPPNSFTRLILSPLSKKAVIELSTNKRYAGEELFRITGGNPFYVTEILQNGTEKVPGNVRDSILSTYYKLPEECWNVLNFFSALPGGLEVDYLSAFEPFEQAAIQQVSELHILVLDGNKIRFKHELYRITIETSLSPFVRIELNKRVLGLFKESFEAKGEIERIVHHAKMANAYDIVVHFAPLAARKASSLGAHVQASKLYRTVIDYYQGKDADTLLQFYEPYAYESFLINQLDEAIIYVTKSLHLLNNRGDTERTGQCLNMLSRFWWFNGHRKESEAYTDQAIDLLKHEPASAAKALAFCGKAYLNLLAGQPQVALSWGEQAVEIAKAMDATEIYCFGLTSVGTVLYKDAGTRQKGWELLQQSLNIARKNAFHEQVGFVYLLAARMDVHNRHYDHALELIDTALQYFEETELILNAPFLQAQKAIVYLDLGKWSEAYKIAQTMADVNTNNHLAHIEAYFVMARVAMRTGMPGALKLLEAANELAQRMEPMFFVPVTAAYLELEWITGNQYVDQLTIDKIIREYTEKKCSYPPGEFAFWYRKSRQKILSIDSVFEGYQTETIKKVRKAVSLWHGLGCPYEQALALFDGNEEDKRAALELVDKLNATVIFEKMKFEMRAEGIKQLPRGVRESTRSNIANLTQRELDVLNLLKEGLANKDIASRLFLSPKTVDHHISSILFKLDVSSRLKAVEEAQRLNILT